MSDLEERFAYQLKVAGISGWIREAMLCKPRKWRWDFAWPSRGLAVEIDGGGWVYGRHNRPQGQKKDNEKHNAAVEQGWRVLRYTAEQVDDGSALAQVERCLKRR